LVSAEEVEAALFLSVARGVPFPRVLIDRGAITERGLEDELERVGGLGLRQVVGAPEVVRRLPHSMCRRLAALPTRVDPATGTIDIAAADPLDPHVGAEFGFHLGAPIRVLRAPIAAVEDAIRRLELDEQEAPERARPRRVTPPFPHGAPQSSNPPPPNDETPIPLVRKVAGVDSLAPPRTGNTGAPPRSTPPYGVAVPSPAPLGSLAQDLKHPTPVPDTAPSAGERRGARREVEPPSVSFPSVPPNGDRFTPPYGTPVYEPPSDGNNAAGSDRKNHRAVPAGEDAYELREVRKTDAAPPRNSPPPLPPQASSTTGGPGQAPNAKRDPRTTTLTSPGQRRNSRPVLAAVPYPAPAPPTVEAPASTAEPPKRVRAPDAAPVLEALRKTTSRDEVIRLAMRGMRLVARRLAVFVVKRDAFSGWACNADFGDEEALRTIVIAADTPSVLATATATAMYLGPIPPTAAHERLLRVMERSSPDVAAVAVRVAGRAVLVLLCDDLNDTMVSTRYLTELAKTVGEALTRLLAR
jgi:hypothetical protein